MVAVAVVFKLLLGPDGPVVYILSALGGENPPYLLYGLNTALPTVVCIAVWKGIGLNFITYLAALERLCGFIRGRSDRQGQQVAEN